jgi:regulator of PEP synthase PpsR (kinase-PPPase family)
MIYATKPIKEGKTPKTLDIWNVFMPNVRSVFYVSDSTAITAKGLGKGLLSQFENTTVTEHLRPYIDSKEKVTELLIELNQAKTFDSRPPIIFASIMDESLMHFLSSQIEGVIDIFQPFIAPLESLLQKKPSKAVGRAHRAGDDDAYKKRIQAIDFTLATDDGLKTESYGQADLILLGVSRTGKTPTALFLALNFGLKVSNYPFTADDLPTFALIPSLKANRQKLIGLIISPDRLHNIRKERLSGSNYADMAQIARELTALKALYNKENIPYVDTSTRSVEEIVASVMNLFARQ